MMKWIWMVVLVVMVGAAADWPAGPPYITPLPTKGTNTPPWVTDEAGTNIVGWQQVMIQNTNWVWAEGKFGVLMSNSAVQMTPIDVSATNSTTWGYGAGLLVPNVAGTFLQVSVGTNRWKRVGLTDW